VSRLSISNLAVSALELPEVLKDLYVSGIRGIEVAPTRLGCWADLSDKRLDSYRAMLEGHGLVVSSLASLCFDTVGLQLLGDRASFDRLRCHLQRVAVIGQRVGANTGVFGSPRNRLRGSLSMCDANELAHNRLLELAETVYTEGFSLGLEPVPSIYGADFLQSASEVIGMVASVNHPGLRVHLDTGCVLLGGDKITNAVAEASGLLVHFHIAEPQLGPFDAPIADHAGAADALVKINYDGWLAIEMIEQPIEPSLKVAEAISVAQRFYSRIL